MSTFDYKNYCITVESEPAPCLDSQADAVHGIYVIWQSVDGTRVREVYRGHTGRTFSSTETSEILGVAQAEARAWIDINEGKPWA